MKIAIKFESPVNGFWDGGPRSGGEFEVDNLHRKSPEHTCFGDWMLNFWFNVKTGRTEKETISRAKRWIKTHCRHPFQFVP